MTEEKNAGSNATAIAEYSETARALADLRQRHQGVVYDVTVSKEMKAAKESRAELRGLRTSLEKTRKEIKSPALERCRLIDAEAKRITAELVSLEEPIDVQIRAEESRVEAERLAKLEEERRRVEALQQKIQAIRDVPASLVGKPSVIIAGQLEKLRGTVLDEQEMGEYAIAADDALMAAIARTAELLDAQQASEAEQKRIKAEREELERIRADNERLQREADERAAADRAEADRKAQAERDRVAAEERTQREAEQAERERLEAIERGKAMEAAAAERERLAAERAAVEAEQKAERERLQAQQELLAREAAAMAKEKAVAAKKAEADRLAGLGLREAAQVLVDYFNNNEMPAIHIAEKFVADLAAALANDAEPAKPSRGKKVAA